ncbi:MAG: hypothetical protein LQ348_004711 [Seirophora lacunosa]|nr:MAG: hypothetical protein LQ348_004711 [Seirophora lacunosa]
MRVKLIIFLVLTVSKKIHHECFGGFFRSFTYEFQVDDGSFYIKTPYITTMLEISWTRVLNVKKVKQRIEANISADRADEKLEYQGKLLKAAKNRMGHDLHFRDKTNVRPPMHPDTLKPFFETLKLTTHIAFLWLELGVSVETFAAMAEGGLFSRIINS